MRDLLRSILILLVPAVVFTAVVDSVSFKGTDVEAGPKTAVPARSAEVLLSGETAEIKPPLGLPPVPIPPDNPPTAETVALGGRLNHALALSVDGTTSCASCHAQQFGFSDDIALSKGVGGKLGGRNASAKSHSPRPERRSGVSRVVDGRIAIQR